MTCPTDYVCLMYPTYLPIVMLGAVVVVVIVVLVASRWLDKR
jgi:hypothetical protein